VSRATVREAIASYLESADIDHLVTVKRFPPKFTPENEFFDDEDPGHSSGVIVFLYFQSQSETRIALGGLHDGRKAVEYTVLMDCYLRSLHVKAEDAASDNEDFIDSLTAAIRADRVAGAPGVVFQWGEGNFPGSADIDVSVDYPRVLRGAGTATQVYSNVRVSVIEILEHN